MTGDYQDENGIPLTEIFMELSTFLDEEIA